MPKARSPSQSPPKQQILPQTTTDLLKSHVLELQERNVELDQAMSKQRPQSLVIETMIYSDANSMVNPSENCLQLQNVSIEKKIESFVTAEPSIVGSTHDQDKHTLSVVGSQPKQKPANQSLSLEINLLKDSCASSLAGAESSMIQEKAQPIQYKLVQQVPIVNIILEKNAIASSTRERSHIKSLPKKPATTTSTYKDKGKSKVESTSPQSTNPPASTLAIIHKCLTNHLAKKQKASSSTTPRTSNGTQHGSHQCSKVYQPKYP